MVMKFLLLANYLPDKQESMRRYAQNLSKDLSDMGITNMIWYPPVFFGKYVSNTQTGLGKYLAYIDKYMLAPIALLLNRLHNTGTKFKYHICDHSNAPYRFYLPRKRTGVTCHDVLAIRGALGHEDAYCPATGMGVLLQKWILRNLAKIPRIAAVSQLTLNQLKELATPLQSYKWNVVYNSLNADFYPMDKEIARTKLKHLDLDLDKPFILHVGSKLPRKNRSMLVKMVAQAREFTGAVVFAGQPIDPDLSRVIHEYELEDRVFEVIKPDHEALVALYSLSIVFVFPSFSEGFGWPIIEAQACGTPVITSALDPMQEVGGEAALFANPYNTDEFASALELVQNQKIRERHILSGYKNIKRFEKDQIINRFLDLYQS